MDLLFILVVLLLIFAVFGFVKLSLESILLVIVIIIVAGYLYNRIR